MKEIDCGNFKFTINLDNYYNANGLPGNPGEVLMRAAGITFITMFNLINADIFGPKVTDFFGVDNNPEMKMGAFAAIFLGVQYPLWGSYTYDKTQEKLQSLHDTLRFSGELAVATMEHAYESAKDSLAVAAVGDIFALDM